MVSLKVVILLSISTEVWAQTHLGPLKMVHSRLKGASGDLSITGPAHFIDVHMSSLRVIGPTVYQDLTVRDSAKFIGPVQSQRGHFKHLKVVGSLEGSDVTCTSLEVTGSVNLNQCHADEVHATGPFEVQGGSIKNLVVTAPEVILNSVHVGNVRILHDQDTIQTLTLKGNTIVQGDVVFESGKGLVKMAPSVRLQGIVRGGHIH